MTDRETGSVWTHFEGKAIHGQLQNKSMSMIVLFHTTWGKWKASHPETMLLSPQTPYRDWYRQVQVGVFNPQEALFGDDRLKPNALIVGVEVGGQYKGYPLEQLQDAGGVINDILADQPIVVIYSENMGGGLAYKRSVNEQDLEFYNSEDEGFELRDRQTESLWDLQGRVLSGPLTGSFLEFVPSFISEWYGWSEYHPETMLFERGS